MPEIGSFLLSLSAILIGLFIISQFGYFLPNILIWTILHRVRPRYVPRKELDEYRDLNVLIPVYKEKRSIIEGTISNVQQSTYPSEHTTIYIIYESDDESVSQFVDQLDATPIEVKEDSEIWDWISVHWGAGIERNKARALDYAVYTIDMNPDVIVAVFDSDTRFPPDLIEYGIAGLDTFDITQSKQTVRNINGGILPLLESMGMSAWCDFIYAKTYDEPYQLLGKGYFMEYRTISGLVGWDPSEPTEDMALGVSAAKSGLQLGILDNYVQDICPSSFSAWITQKRRWVAGPYRMLLKNDLKWRDGFGFMSYTIANQTIALTNIIGIPSGLFMLALFIRGGAPDLPVIVDFVVIINLISWAYFSVLSLYAAKRSVPLENINDIKYWILSNPITQIFYAALWSIPIILALYDIMFSDANEFSVTPKE